MSQPIRKLRHAVVGGVLAAMFGLGSAMASAPPPDAKLHGARLGVFWALERFKVNRDVAVKEQPILKEYRKLSKAAPDECFDGIGNPYPSGPPCATGTPKRNEAYVWGLVKTGPDLWFGTVANTHCLVISGFLGLSAAHDNPYWACEFDQARSETGDWRPPKVYRHRLISGQTEDKSPTGLAGWLLSTTVGLRSAGEAKGVVFLAGPSLIQGINVFAFDAATGASLGAKNLPQYGDVRSWLTVDGVLHVGVGVSGIPAPGEPGGAILRWTGDKQTPEQLFNFEVVGKLDAAGANLALHHGRIAVSTWPVLDALRPTNNRLTGVYLSPRIPEGGLTSADAEDWEKIWQIDDYDPDPIAALTTGGGALASFKGKLYWGTMHVPFMATSVAIARNGTPGFSLDANQNGSLDPEELVATALGTHRSVALFEASCDGPSDRHRISLIYGERFLPRFDPQARSYTIDDDKLHANRLGGVRPRWGSSGFGNFFNTYLWAMQVHQGSLYMGTFDWSQLARVGVQDIAGLPAHTTAPLMASIRKHLGSKLPIEGADLLRMDSCDGRLRAESLSGVRNDTNYGIRTMVSGEALFLGTANPMNLHPKGGWELLGLRKRR